MKLIARILLFIAFLSTPAIITVIKKSIDTSISFTCSEEELGDKELEAAVYPSFFEDKLVVLVCKESKLIVSEEITKLETISPSIFAPPPNLS